MDRKKWACGITTLVISIKPFRLFPVGFHGVNAGIKEQLEQCIVEEATHLRNKMEHIQWEHVYSHKVECKFTLEQNMKVQRGSRCTALLFLNLGARWGWVFKPTPRPHYPREKDPVPHVKEIAWVPGPVWMSAGSLPSSRDSSPKRVPKI